MDTQFGVVNIFGGKRAADSGNTSDLGNGEKRYGYATKGVNISYLKVADIVQFSESVDDSRTDNHVEVLYGINKFQGADFLTVLSLENHAKYYTVLALIRTHLSHIYTNPTGPYST